jgi:hypothetical protein
MSEIEEQKEEKISTETQSSKIKPTESIAEEPIQEDEVVNLESEEISK